MVEDNERDGMRETHNELVRRWIILEG